MKTTDTATGVIIFALVPFKEYNGAKLRPALIMKATADGGALAYKITSQYENKSVAVKTILYEITDLKAAGLPKRSWIDFHRIIALPEKTIQKAQEVGRMSIEDLNAFIRHVLDSKEAIAKLAR